LPILPHRRRAVKRRPPMVLFQFQSAPSAGRAGRPRRGASAGSLLAFIVVAVLATLAAEGSAQASSIFFAKDGNVWLARPDGSGPHQVTLDGTPSDPYESPSQADDGTILAARGTLSATKLYRMRQNGELLMRRSVRRLPSPVLTIRLFRPWQQGRLQLPDLCRRLSARGDALQLLRSLHGPGRVRRPGKRPRSVLDGQCAHAAVLWIGQHRRARGRRQLLQEWFRDSDFFSAPDTKNYHDGEITRAGDKIAVVRKNYDEDAEIFLFAEINPPLRQAPSRPGGETGARKQGEGGGKRPSGSVLNLTLGGRRAQRALQQSAVTVSVRCNRACRVKAWAD
jgi:hypothetical protein